MALWDVVGTAGETGPAGPKGDKGDKGDTGATGADGAAGPAGADGAAGFYYETADFKALTSLPLGSFGGLQDELFRVQRVPTQTLPANSSAVIDVALDYPVDTVNAFVMPCSPRSNNGGPTSNYNINPSKYLHTYITLPNGRTVRFDPTPERAEANCPPCVVSAQVVESYAPVGDPYEIQVIGPLSVTVTGTNTSATGSLGITLPDNAARGKVIFYEVGHTSGAVPREQGAIAFCHNTTSFTVLSAQPPTGNATTITYYAVWYKGSNWKVHHAYSGLLDASDAGDIALKSLPPTAFSSGTFTADGAATSTSVSAWNRAFVASGLSRGVDISSNVSQYTCGVAPAFLPGTGADANNLSNINWLYNAAHSLSGQNLYAYVLEDLGSSTKGMVVTRFVMTSPADSSTVALDITSAGIVKPSEALFTLRTISGMTGSTPSGATGTPPAGGTGGYTGGACLGEITSTTNFNLTVPYQAQLDKAYVTIVKLPRSVVAA